jgi:integrase/recombinase XerD
MAYISKVIIDHAYVPRGSRPFRNEFQVLAFFDLTFPARGQSAVKHPVSLTSNNLKSTNTDIPPQRQNLVTSCVLRNESGFGRTGSCPVGNWRPFAGPLSASSQRQAGVILNALFSWLVNAGYLAGNPLALSRERKRRAPPRVTRYLDDELWTEVKATVDSLPRETPREREHYFRLRWVVTLCYVCGLRISEIAANSMGGFFRRRDQDGEERWWLEVLGKGDKLRIVPATNELMVELARYRRELAYPPYPVPGESTPLLLPIGGRPRSMTRGGIHEIIKAVFAKTSERLRARGPEFAPAAERVLQASAHWLRHTAGSHMANNDVDLRHVRDNLGHESISTTNTYLHSGDKARHVETESKHRVNW